MTIGERIRMLRTEAGYTQDELSKLLGYKSRSTINKIETDEREPTQSMVVKFARVFNTTPSVIVGWEGAEKESVLLLADEKKLLDSFRKTNSEGQNMIIEYAEFIATNGKYKKCNSVPADIS